MGPPRPNPASPGPDLWRAAMGGPYAVSAACGGTGEGGADPASPGSGPAPPPPHGRICDGRRRHPEVVGNVGGLPAVASARGDGFLRRVASLGGQFGVLVARPGPWRGTVGVRRPSELSHGAAPRRHLPFLRLWRATGGFGGCRRGSSGGGVGGGRC
jgi:hypothetical protein